MESDRSVIIFAFPKLKIVKIVQKDAKKSLEIIIINI
jgi:hypothetical protein